MVQYLGVLDYRELYHEKIGLRKIIPMSKQYSVSLVTRTRFLLYPPRGNFNLLFLTPPKFSVLLICCFRLPAVFYVLYIHAKNYTGQAGHRMPQQKTLQMAF